MNKKPRLWLILFIALAVLFVGVGYKPVNARNGYGWAPDEKVPGYLDDTFPPFLIADQNRTVHAFTSQWVKVNEESRQAIVYRQWSLLGGWTRPVDIILSPLGGNASFLSAYMDSSDTMHLIFSATEALTRKSYVYYTSAPAANADWAPAWSEPLLVGDALSLNSAAIVGDNHGDLVVIYSGNRDGSGVYSIESKDAGKSWSSPQSVFLTYDSGLNAFSLRLSVGPDLSIRAVWTVVTNTGVDEAIYFANFDEKNSNWDAAVELDQRMDNKESTFGPSYPSIVDNGHVVVVSYNNGNFIPDLSVAVGRPVKFVYVSNDGGLTWKGPSEPFPLHNGRSGEDGLALDGDGNPHMLFIQRIDTVDENGSYKSVGGIWHSVFLDGSWSNLDRLVTTVAAHDVRMIVCQGNVLLAVWRKDPGGGNDGVWYSYKILDEPELPVIPLATDPASYSSVQQTATPVPVIINTPGSAPQPGLLNEAPPSNLGENPALPIIVGAVPVFLILIGVVLGYRFLTSRRE